MAFNQTQILGQAVFTNADPVVLGGPWPGKHVIVTDISVFVSTVAGTYIYVAGAADTGSIVFPAPADVGSPGLYWHGHQALIDGDTLNAGSDNATAVYVRVTGWIFSA